MLPNWVNFAITMKNGTNAALRRRFELGKLLKLDAPLACAPAAADRKHYICHAGRMDLAKVLLSAGYAVAAPGSGAAYHDAEQEGPGRKARDCGT